MQDSGGESLSATSPQAGYGGGVPAAFEEAYLRYASLLRTIAIGKFRIRLSTRSRLRGDVPRSSRSSLASITST